MRLINFFRLLWRGLVKFLAAICRIIGNFEREPWAKFLLCSVIIAGVMYIPRTVTHPAAMIGGYSDPAPVAEEEQHPTYPVRWETLAYTDPEDTETAETLQEGDMLELVRPYVTDQYHLMDLDGLSLYVPVAAVDITESDAVYRFDPNGDMREMTGFTAEQLERCLSPGMQGLGDDYAKAEAEYGLNALFMISIAELESGFGTSGLAQNKNNLIGLKSYDGWASFDSKEECVDYHGRYLSNNYLDPEGSFHNGSTIRGVSIVYCGESEHWVNQVTHLMEDNLETILAGE